MELIAITSGKRKWQSIEAVKLLQLVKACPLYKRYPVADMSCRAVIYKLASGDHTKPYPNFRTFCIFCGVYGVDLCQTYYRRQPDVS